MLRSKRPTTILQALSQVSFLFSNRPYSECHRILKHEKWVCCPEMGFIVLFFVIVLLAPLANELLFLVENEGALQNVFNVWNTKMYKTRAKKASTVVVPHKSFSYWVLTRPLGTLNTANRKLIVFSDFFAIALAVISSITLKSSIAPPFITERTAWPRGWRRPLQQRSGCSVEFTPRSKLPTTVCVLFD